MCATLMHLPNGHSVLNEIYCIVLKYHFGKRENHSPEKYLSLKVSEAKFPIKSKLLVVILLT